MGMWKYLMKASGQFYVPTALTSAAELSVSTEQGVDPITSFEAVRTRKYVV
jgi:hypothetical protein